MFRDVISEEEHDLLVREIEVDATDDSIKRFRRRKYASDHWDSVITGYKELERPLTLWNSYVKHLMLIVNIAHVIGLHEDRTLGYWRGYKDSCTR